MAQFMFETDPDNTLYIRVLGVEDGPEKSVYVAINNIPQYTTPQMLVDGLVRAFKVLENHITLTAKAKP